MLIYILLLLPVPLILVFQLNLTSWSHQYLSNLFLKVFTDSALTTASGRLLQTIKLCWKRKVYEDHISQYIQAYVSHICPSSLH